MSLEQLMQSPIAWLILSMITILSFLFAIYMWIAGKTKRQISFAKSSYNIVKNRASKISKLKLFFNDKEIEDITITKFAIWNSGNTTIKKGDIVKKEPLRIISKGSADILEVSILMENDTSNEFVIDLINEKLAEIYFDYMDKNNGIVVQVIHNGLSSDLCIEGKIKGGKGIKNYKKGEKHISNKKKNKQGKNDTIVFILMQILVIMLTIIIIILAMFKFVDFEDIIALVTCILAQFATLLLSDNVKNVLKIGIPLKLRVYDEYDDTEEK